MYIFGHVGITAAVVRASDVLFPENAISDDKDPGIRSRMSRLIAAIRNRTGGIDYRMVIIGSVLPDIIDKSVYLLAGAGNETLSGRDYAHSLLFNVLLFAGGLFLLRYRKSWLLLLSIGSLIHLLLDRIWNDSVTFLWPFMGSLQGEPSAGWVSEMWIALFTKPGVYVPEIIGLLVLLYFAFRIVKNRGISGFIRNGSIA